MLEGGKERERNIDVWLPLRHPPLGTWPTTQACALTGKRMSDPLVHSLALNPLSHTTQRPSVFFKSAFLIRSANIYKCVFYIKYGYCTINMLRTEFFKNVSCFPGELFSLLGSQRMIPIDLTWSSPICYVTTLFFCYFIIFKKYLNVGMYHKTILDYIIVLWHS